jgi:16S rRNA (cytidine1402-2'-O)-methyltransferase
MKRFNIKTPLVSLQNYNEAKQVNTVLKQLKEGKNIALVSDAGTPNICDPGAYFIHQLRTHHISIVPIPGPSAVTALLSVSGIRSSTFYFGGFFPKTQTEYTKQLSQLESLNCPLVFFETAKRLTQTLTRLSTYPAARLVLGKELTKTFETIIEGSIETIQSQLKEIPLKGEFCLILMLNAAYHKDQKDQEWIQSFKDAQLTAKQGVLIGSQLGISKNDIKKALYND